MPFGCKNPAALQRNKLDTPLLAAGFLIPGQAGRRRLQVGGSLAGRFFGHVKRWRLFPMVQGQRENKFCPNPFGTDDIDIFIMCQDNFLYNGEAEPGSLLILSP